MTHLSPILDEDLNDNVGKLDVHDGGNGLLLSSKQSRAEADAKVRDGHHVALAVCRHLVMNYFVNLFSASN